MKHTSDTLREAFGYLYPDEIDALKKLVLMLPKNPLVINIGAGAGTSGLAIMESRPDVYLQTVDISKESNPFGCLDAEKDILIEAGLWDEKRCLQIHQDSKQYAKDFQLKCDMVFIDGDHSEEGCKGDILAWLPNVKADGIIAIHDYKKHLLYTDTYNFDNPKTGWPHPRAWPDVDKAVDEMLLRRYEQVLYVDSLIAFRV